MRDIFRINSYEIDLLHPLCLSSDNLLPRHLLFFAEVITSAGSDMHSSYTDQITY